MIKNVIKLIAITVITIAALTLTGCAENREKPLDVNEIVNSVFEESSTPSEIEENSTSEVEDTSTSTVENSNPSTVEKPTASTSEVESKPEEKPVSSSTSTVEKPVEKPTSPSTTTTTSSKPASSSTPASSTPASTTSSTTSKPVEKPTSSSTSTTTSKLVEKPVEKPTHNCSTDGHVWGKTYTKVSGETVEIKETHTVSGCGYDYDLAYEYFGRSKHDVDWGNYFEDYAGYGSGSTKVKTTGTKTITKYYHECSECGFNEIYNTEEIVTPGDTWEFVNPAKRGFFTIVWYDINNIPDEVYEAVAKDNKAREDFINSLG